MGICQRVLLLCVLLPALMQPARAVEIGLFTDTDKFETIKLSPTGEYYAITVPLENQTVLAIRRRADHQMVGSFSMGTRTHVHNFWWVNDKRVVFSIAERLGSLDQPRPLGELYAMNVDGSNAEILVGLRLVGGKLGTRLGTKKEERVAALMVDDLPNDERHVLIDVFRFINDPESRVEKMDVYTGERRKLVQGPIPNVSFVTDNAGNVRFAQGGGIDSNVRLYYREGAEDSPWKLVNDESVSGHAEHAIGFSQDDRTAYLLVQHAQGPDSVVAFDIGTSQRTELLRDDNVDPASVIYRPGTGVPVGIAYMDGKPRTAFFDGTSPEARLQRSLEAAFKGQAVDVISTTSDGKLALIEVSSDRNPGDVYVFDIPGKKADYLVSRREKIDPATMAEMRPVSLKARDQLALNGYLTLPPGSDGKRLPMVVMPHGGPFGIYDSWGFDPDVQLLAASGYAVLQIDFRGSGNYGRAFHQAGARQWGAKMQDDVTDATRWAVEQGYADPARVCIYGASYGGYAALMGAAREPDLYKCAAGYVGVYELSDMYAKGDIQQSRSGEAFLRQWLGPKDALAAVSPTRLAGRIKAPVFLAAGGEDDRAPIQHSRRMEQALKAANVPVETLYYPKEGHGFYVEANKREFQSRLLGFLERHIGNGALAAGD
jgi:dipeptidyl aminopeptidase/acylaminoacyl peptidase